MSADGKRLEALVAFIEGKFLSQDFDVITNERVYDEEGVQIAEFDILISGKVGTASFCWLIECRDRPTEGPAPGSWIEQLVGRRDRFGFDRVTAVSTTGFSSGAASFAKERRIDLREVRNLDPSEFSGWLFIRSMRQVLRVADLKHADLKVHPNTPREVQSSFEELIAGVDGNTPVLLHPSWTQKLRVSDAFLAAVQQTDEFSNLVAGQAKLIELDVVYTEEAQFVVETSVGPARLSQIRFVGELRLELVEVPLEETIEYRAMASQETISQTATFVPQDIAGDKWVLELHRLSETGQTHITMRKLASDVSEAQHGY
jgi:hypothetical protein